MLVAESEKRRKGEGDEGEERRRGVRRRRKRQGNDRRAREKSERRHEQDKTSGRMWTIRTSARQQSRSNRAKTSRDASPTRPLQHSQLALTMDATSVCTVAFRSTVFATRQPPPSASLHTAAHTHSDPSFCKSCHACIHCLDKPPPYPTALSTSVLPFPLPGNGYVSILRVYSAETIFHRLELSTSKRSSKEDQALLALIRKLLSYFQHIPTARVHPKPLPAVRQGQRSESLQRVQHCQMPLLLLLLLLLLPLSLALRLLLLLSLCKLPQWTPPTEPLPIIPPSEWTVSMQPSDSAADTTTSTASTASATSDHASTSPTSSDLLHYLHSLFASVITSFCRPRDNVLLRYTAPRSSTAAAAAQSAAVPAEAKRAALPAHRHTRRAARSIQSAASAATASAAAQVPGQGQEPSEGANQGAVGSSTQPPRQPRLRPARRPA